ncbi:MAG: lysoplasmalogenase [Anaerolineaceae bacterium]|nr:lysoplasmalogenase [Anaerolineaceae bacterium]
MDLAVILWVGIGLFAAADWIATAKHARRIRYVTKPLPLVLLLALEWHLTRWTGGMWVFGIGLAFGLLGDIFLMVPNQRCFLLGLCAFLVGHLFYAVGFNLDGLPDFSWQAVLLLLIPLGMMLLVTRQLLPYVKDRMRVPVRVYIGVITTMLYAAFLTLLQPAWNTQSALCAICGAGLFTFSDWTLAINRFVCKRPNWLVMATYHSAQVLIAFAAMKWALS